MVVSTPEPGCNAAKQSTGLVDKQSIARVWKQVA